MSIIGRVAPFLCGATSYDADALAWRAAVIANGGTVSNATLTAVSDFCIAAKASGYWTKFNRLNLFCGDQLAACLVPLKIGGGNATETNVNFVSGDYTEATGLKGNGSTKLLKTGLIPSVSLTLNDTHLATYNRAASATGGGDAVAADTTVGRMSLLAPYSDGTAISNSYSTATSLQSGVVSAPYGMVVGSRTSTTSHVIYKGGSSIATSATVGGALPTRQFFVFAENNSGGTGVDGPGNFFMSHPLAMYSIGAGLSAADVTAYNTHMQAFQTALNRNV